MDAGHSNEIIDLYATGFDPVVRSRDSPNWIDEAVPVELLDKWNLKQQVLDSSGGPIQRFIVSRWLRDKTPLDIVKMIREHRPKEILEQQEKVAKRRD